MDEAADGGEIDWFRWKSNLSSMSSIIEVSMWDTAGGWLIRDSHPDMTSRWDIKCAFYDISFLCNAHVTHMTISSMVTYGAQIMINHDTILVIHGRAILPAFDNLVGPQQYFSNRHRPRSAREIMTLSSNPPAIRSYHTQPGLICDELNGHRTVILWWSYIIVMSPGES